MPPILKKLMNFGNVRVRKNSHTGELIIAILQITINDCSPVHLLHTEKKSGIYSEKKNVNCEESRKKYRNFCVDSRRIPP